jgi:hypothetical protein
MILTKSKTVFNKCVCTVNLCVAVSSLGNNVCDGIPKLSYLLLFLHISLTCMNYGIDLLFCK